MLATISITMITVSMLVTSLYHLYLTTGWSSTRSSTSNSGELQGSAFSIITPIKDEPEEVVERYLQLFTKLIESVKISIECIVVADYRDDRAFSSIVTMLSRASPGIVVARRLNGAGGRNGAINDGVKLSLGGCATFIDVDAEPSREAIESMAGCRNVCISWWRVCDKGKSRASKTIAFITEYGSWLYYWAKSMKNLFLFPLGSGTVLKKDLFTSIGGLRADVIQDDIWLGTQLIRRGIHPALATPICVGAPRTLDAFLVQQRRWAYGATDVLRRFWTHIVESPAPIHIKIDAILYIIQPIVAALGGFGLLLSVASALVEVVHLSAHHTVLVALLLLSMILEGTAVARFLKWSRDPFYDAPYIVGRASALTVVLSIDTLPYVVAALVGVRIPYRVTPKMEMEGTVPATVRIAAIAFTASMIMSIARGNAVAAIVAALGAAATVYTAIRLR
ncbi:MAG: glycosyltransferase family 2 protein [Ignisphaera sp.]|nr:glycosyltransferase family 2 protein [Ignisphaera sp.]MDW8084714.1 glycosyltransferase family 2 protein [Ignisphaera sp.]